LVDFVRDALVALGASCEAFVVDLVRPPLLPPADVALLLKTLPCLEAQQGERAFDLVAALPAPLVAVSFPAHSLGGRRRTLGEHHAQRFERLAARRGWSWDSFEAAGERVFLVRTGSPTPSSVA
jgi:16S rRNA (guanine(1405)-N(7))-methyltransferase